MIRRVSAFLLTIFAILLVVSAVSQAQSQALLTRHVREVTVNGKAPSVGRLPLTQTMNLDILLPLRHQQDLDNFLRQLYDPTSPSYRHFLTVEEFTARFGPNQSDYNTVVRFARANGFKVNGAAARNRMEVQVSGNVAAVEKAFHITMEIYQHPTENRSFYAPDREPSVDLPFQLWHISGLDNYSIPKPMFHARPEGIHENAVLGSCPHSSYCGSDMRAAYYGETALDGTGQSVGLFEYAGTNLADLNTYYKNVGQTENVPITLLSVDGTATTCKYPKCDDTEQTIDMTQALGMAPNLSSLVMYIGSTDSAIFNAMATASPLNAQLSSSWYWSPADSTTLDPIFQEFAAQGQNLFDAAGDHQDWQRSGSIWPADDAYLTSVGGTDLETVSAGGAWSSETAWADSGGGISPNHIAIPSWQVAAAAGCADCSQVYRNGPDVAAEANFDFYYCADQTGCGTGLGGTSFAAPMWAGYLALVNQQAVANGQPTLGFINPAIYTLGLGSSYDSDFHDITSGSNGYSATVGYDLATGWGSPNGPSLINALVGTPVTGFSLSANPSSLTIAQGAQGTSTITVTPSGGFTGSVTLAASGLPSGVTATFAPNPTGTTSTLTLAASSTATAGTATVTITGTSGSLTSTTTVKLTVTAPGFSLSANPTSLTVTQGSQGTSTITVTPTGGFSGNVTLSASGLPGGVTASFSPNPTSSSSTLTLAASATAATGTATITISGTSGSLTGSTTLSLTVNAQSTGPTVTVTPSTLTWGTVVLGATGPVKTVTLTNTGSTTLNISSVTTSGDFAQTTSTKPCGSTLAAGKSCLIKVTFTPTQLGTRTGTLTLTDNSPSSPQTVALSGTGGVQAKLTPVSATFATEKVGTTSPAKTFTLANEQAVSLTGISITATGDFAVASTTCGSSLAAKTSCTISVTFTPTATGTRTGTLSVADSAIGSPQTSSLQGTGK